MTFITSFIASNGIVVAADSLELIQGGMIKWEHFDEILKAKNLSDEDKTDKISPFEIREKFRLYHEETKGRITNFDGAKKIFKITDTSCLLIAGKADIGAKTVDEIVDETISAIKTVGSQEVSISANIIKDVFEKHITAETEIDRTTELIYSGINQSTGLFAFVHIKWEQDIVRDDKGVPKLNDKGRPYQDWVFKRVNPSTLLNKCGQVFRQSVSGISHFLGVLV
jgi:hypothetical protein